MKKQLFLWRQFTGRQVRLIIFFFCAVSPFFSDGQVLDSLERRLKDQSLTPAQKLKIYDDLSWFYNSVDVQRSVEFGRKGLALAQKSHDLKMEGIFLRNLAVASYMGGKYDPAMGFLEKARPIADKLQDYQLQSSLYNTYANIYLGQSQYDLALENYFAVAKICEEHKDPKKLIIVWSNIGIVYQTMRNFDQALKYLRKAEKLGIEIKSRESLGSIYVSLSDIALIQKKPKKLSVEYARKAIDIFRKSGDKFAENEARITLAKVYYNHKDYQNAESAAQQVFTFAKDMGSPRLAAKTLIILSNIRYHQQRYTQAAELAKEALEHDSADFNITVNAYSNLAKASAYLKHPDLTEKYIEDYRKAADHHSNQTYQQSLSGMEIKYETEKKELKIKALEKQRQTYVWMGVAMAAVLLSALIFAFTRYRLAVSRRKLAEEENQRLEQEKQLSATQALLQGQEDERSRMAKELHDGLGGLLSGVKLNLNNMDKKLIITEEDGASFEKSISLLDESISELRRVAHNLMPESILKFGLDGAIREFLQTISSPQLQITYQSYHIEKGISKQLDISTYRIVQELVNNAIKHAEASEILVQLRKDEQLLIIDVEDNGKGFDTGADQKEHGMGLAGIRSRVTYWKGTWQIDSSESSGTTVHIEIPV